MKTKISFALFAVLVVLVVIAFVQNRDDTESPSDSAAAGLGGMSISEHQLRERRVTRICEQSVKQQMRDPDSAQFRDEVAMPDTPDGLSWRVTGEVNGRNGFGGMVGYMSFSCTATYDADTEQTRGEATIIGR